MRRPGGGRGLRALSVRQIALGAGMLFALVTAATFVDVSGYLDRAAVSKRASRGPSVVRPIHPAAPATSAAPDAQPPLRPPAIPAPVPPSARAADQHQTSQAPRRASPARTPEGTPGGASVYGTQRQENFGR